MRAHVSVERKSLAVARSLADVPASNREGNASPRGLGIFARRFAHAKAGEQASSHPLRFYDGRERLLYEERLAGGGDVLAVMK